MAEDAPAMNLNRGANHPDPSSLYVCAQWKVTSLHRELNTASLRLHPGSKWGTRRLRLGALLDPIFVLHGLRRGQSSRSNAKVGDGGLRHALSLLDLQLECIPLPAYACNHIPRMPHSAVILELSCTLVACHLFRCNSPSLAL